MIYITRKALESMIDQFDDKPMMSDIEYEFYMNGDVDEEDEIIEFKLESIFVKNDKFHGKWKVCFNSGKIFHYEAEVTEYGDIKY